MTHWAIMLTLAALGSALALVSSRGVTIQWEVPQTNGITSSRIYWGTSPLTYQWNTNVLWPTNTVAITPTNQNTVLYICAIVISTNGAGSWPGAEMCTFLPAVAITNPSAILTNSPQLSFISGIQYRMETATNPAGPWLVYTNLNTNFVAAVGIRYFRVNFVR